MFRNFFEECCYEYLSYVAESKMLHFQNWCTILESSTMLFHISVNDLKFEVLKWKVCSQLWLIGVNQTPKSLETWHDIVQVELSDKVTHSWHQNCDNMEQFFHDLLPHRFFQLSLWGFILCPWPSGMLSWQSHISAQIWKTFHLYHLSL